jgi:hypothetical protein
VANNDSSWPRKFPIYRMLGFILAILWTLAIFRLWWELESPLERFHFWQYAKVSLLSEHPLILGKSFTYAFEEPDSRLKINEVKMLPEDYRETVRVYKYDGKTFCQVIKMPLIFSGAFLVLLVGLGAFLDRQRADRSSPLRGPKLVSWFKLRRGTDKEDIRITLAGYAQSVIIAAKVLAQHIQISGDTGSGKSTVLRQIITQARERGDAGIVFDPKGEYLEEYWQPGDIVLNPLDQRCPYWALEDEAESEAQATAIALGFWPDEPNQQPFFKKHPRAIFSYLIWRYNRRNAQSQEDTATCLNLAKWLNNPRKLVSPKLKGTRHAVSTDANAKDQSQGLWSTLGEAATPLAMMPPESEDRIKWTVKDWVKQRESFIFITSTPDTLDALRPLQSLWIDMLIMKLQATVRMPWQKRVWLFLDELADLQKLPQLNSALTKQRHSGNPVVLGFQGMGKINDLYGKNTTQTLLSQAFTNIVLRTREPEAAEHQSGLVGKAQYERVKESRPAGLLGWRKRSYTTEKPIEAVVMASEIQTLPDLTGYFVQLGNIVKIKIRRFDKILRAAKLIDREIPVEPIDTEAVEPEPNISLSVF